jgi:hypothetical protein
MRDITVSDCPICARGYPLDLLAELPIIWLTGGIDAPLPGYACVAAKRQVAEPFELSEAERIGFWEDCMRAARTLARPIQPAQDELGDSRQHDSALAHASLSAVRGRPLRGPLDQQ